MTIMSIVLAAAEDPTNPEHAAGRADAYDEHATDGTTLEILMDRYAWMEDPRAARGGRPVTTAYLAGYLAYIRDETAGRHFRRYTAQRDHQAWASRA